MRQNEAEMLVFLGFLSIKNKGLPNAHASVRINSAICPLSLAVRTPPSHGGIRGSIPLGGTTVLAHYKGLFSFFREYKYTQKYTLCLFSPV